MSREIKFRAWHTEQNRMFEVYGIGPDFVTENTLDGVDPGVNAFMGDDMQFIHVMQYAGLKDKNGKEIYDGDVVEMLDNELSPGKYVIHWREDVYMMVGTGGPGEWLSMEEFEGCELIGNIHEKPELLKGGDNNG